MNTTLADIKDNFKELGIKSTLPRVVIYQALMKFTHHPSAEEIHIGIQKKYPGVSLATVYKTLDLLVQNNLASKVVTDEDKVRYDPRTDQHIHLYCKKTNKIVDHEDAGLEKLIADYLNLKGIPGFDIHQIQVNIKGELKTIIKK
ncbi:MAG: transcriptional repressor [Bacteroidia bacterium]|nr:transcriptional repressor [Bacteroidia bacterium]MCF8428143.1 transcriptional repressor [Bacteroidia bacterium]MCF8447903.1 transcriptional repressor [Bacteroidia bacterium]